MTHFFRIEKLLDRRLFLMLELSTFMSNQSRLFYFILIIRKAIIDKSSTNCQTSLRKILLTLSMPTALLKISLIYRIICIKLTIAAIESLQKRSYVLLMRSYNCKLPFFPAFMEIANVN